MAHRISAPPPNPTMIKNRTIKSYSDFGTTTITTKSDLDKRIFSQCIAVYTNKLTVMWIKR